MKPRAPFSALLLLTLVLAFVATPAFAASFQFPFLGVSDQDMYAAQKGFSLQWALFGGMSGSSGSALYYLALTAAFIGALLLVFNKNFHKFPTVLAWFVLVVVMLFAPYNSRLLFYPLSGNAADKCVHTMVGTTGTPQSGMNMNGICGFTPQLFVVHLGSVLQVLFYDLLHSAGLKNMVECANATSQMMNSPIVTPGPASIDALKAFQAECGGLPYPVDYQNPSQPGASAGGQVATFGDMVKKIRDSYDNNAGPTDRPVIGLPQTKPNGWEPDMWMGYQQGLASIYKQFVTGPGSQVNVGDTADTKTNTISVQDALSAINDKMMALTDQGPGWTGGNSALQGPSNIRFFVAPLQGGTLPDSDFSLRSRANYRNCDTGQNFATTSIDSQFAASCIMGDSNYNINNDERSAALSEALRMREAIFNSPEIAGMPVMEVVTTRTGCSDMNEGVGLGGVGGSNMTNCQITASAPMAVNDCATKAKSTFMTICNSNLQASSVGQDAPLLTKYCTDLSNGVDVCQHQTDYGSLASNCDASSQCDGGSGADYGRMAVDMTAQRSTIHDGATAEERNAMGNSNPEALGWLGKNIGWGLSFATDVAVQLGSAFSGATAIAIISILRSLMALAFSAIPVVTPIFFLMGLLIPGNAPGLLFLSVMSLMVLKLVPVTWMIIDFIASSLQGMLEGTQEALLLLGVAGLYLGSISLTLFIMFKIGDPGNLSRMASLDGAAKQAVDAGTKLAAAAAALATLAVGGAAIGAAGTAMGSGKLAAAGAAMKNKALGMVAGADPTGATGAILNAKGTPPGGAAAAATTGPGTGPNSGGAGVVPQDPLMNALNGFASETGHTTSSIADQMAQADMESRNAFSMNGMDPNGQANSDVFNFTKDGNGQWSMTKVIPDTASAPVTDVPADMVAQNVATTTPVDASGQPVTTGPATATGATTAAGTGAGGIAATVRVEGGQLDTVGSIGITGPAAATTSEQQAQAARALQMAQAAENADAATVDAAANIQKDIRESASTPGSGGTVTKERLDEIIRENTKGLNPEQQANLGHLDLENVDTMKALAKKHGIEPSAFEAMEMNFEEIKDANGKVIGHKNEALAELMRINMKDSILQGATSSLRIAEKADATRFNRNDEDEFSKMGGFRRAAYGGLSGLIGGISAGGGGLRSIPIIGTALAESMNEFTQAGERARGWAVRGGGTDRGAMMRGFMTRQFTDKNRTARGRYWAHEAAEMGTSDQFTAMNNMGNRQAQVNLARQAANEAAQQVRSQFDALTAKVGLMRGSDVNIADATFHLDDLSGLGTMGAAQRIESVFAETSMYKHGIPIGVDKDGNEAFAKVSPTIALTLANATAVKSVSSNLDALLAQHYKATEKHMREAYMSSGSDPIATSHMTSSQASVAKYLRKDVDTDYAAGALIDIVQKKAQFMQMRGQYAALRGLRVQDIIQKDDMAKALEVQFKGMDMSQKQAFFDVIGKKMKSADGLGQADVETYVKQVSKLEGNQKKLALGGIHALATKRGYMQQRSQSKLVQEEISNLTSEMFEREIKLMGRSLNGITEPKFQQGRSFRGAKGTNAKLESWTNELPSAFAERFGLESYDVGHRRMIDLAKKYSASKGDTKSINLVVDSHYDANKKTASHGFSEGFMEYVDKELAGTSDAINGQIKAFMASVKANKGTFVRIAAEHGRNGEMADGFSTEDSGTKIYAHSEAKPTK